MNFLFLVFVRISFCWRVLLVLHLREVHHHFWIYFVNFPSDFALPVLENEVFIVELRPISHLVYIYLVLELVLLLIFYSLLLLELDVLQTILLLFVLGCLAVVVIHVEVCVESKIRQLIVLLRCFSYYHLLVTLVQLIKQVIIQIVFFIIKDDSHFHLLLLRVVLYHRVVHGLICLVLVKVVLVHQSLMLKPVFKGLLLLLHGAELRTHFLFLTFILFQLSLRIQSVTIV